MDLSDATADPAGGVVICQPVQAIIPLTCRRGTGNRAMSQGQPVPKCDGVLPNRKYFDVKKIEYCPKCGLGHGFASSAEGMLYGAIL